MVIVSLFLSFVTGPLVSYVINELSEVKLCKVIGALIHYGRKDISLMGLPDILMGQMNTP